MNLHFIFSQITSTQMDISHFRSYINFPIMYVIASITFSSFFIQVPLMAQAPCQGITHEYSMFHLIPPPPCLGESQRTYFQILHDNYSTWLASYCDQTTVFEDPDMDVKGFMEWYLNHC